MKNEVATAKMVREVFFFKYQSDLIQIYTNTGTSFHEVQSTHSYGLLNHNIPSEGGLYLEGWCQVVIFLKIVLMKYKVLIAMVC